MYGLLIESIVEFAKRRYGNAVWDKVRKKAKIENYMFSTHQQYSETLLNKIVKTLAEVTEQNQNDLMELLGIEFVNFVGQFGYDRILRVLGRHMRDFLNGLDNLHEYMRFSYAKLKPPSFFVEKETANGLILHYRSKRKGYLYYVKGQIKQVGKVFYNLDVKIDVLSDTQEGELTHVIFKLHFKNDYFNTAPSSTNISMISGGHHHRHIAANLPIKSEIFFELFPFHVVFKKNMEIISIGDGLAQAMKHAEGESIKDLFNLARPLISFTWENIISHTNNVFEVTTIEPVRRSSSPTPNDDSRSNANLTTQSSMDSSVDECLKLKGQMMYVKEWEAIIFLATPVLENLEAMFNTGFYINDLSMHDSSRDLVLVGTQQSAELKLALDQEKQKSKALEDSMKKLDIEMKRTDQLLYQMIPKKIADRLRSGEPVMNLCEVVPNCTILFSDVVGFTSTCSLLSPMEVVSMLNGMYTKFDKCLEAHNVYKVETIGDAYMVVSGLPERTKEHAVEIIEMGFDMLNAISTLNNPATDEPMKIRVGCHSGPVVAGVVGLKMPRYCLFGDTVNTASRMESSSEAMKIHISEYTRNLIQTKPYKIVERGKVEIKGKGEMKTYFVLSKVDEDGKSIKCPFMEIFEEYKSHQNDSNYHHHHHHQDNMEPINYENVIGHIDTKEKKLGSDYVDDDEDVNTGESKENTNNQKPNERKYSSISSLNGKIDPKLQSVSNGPAGFNSVASITNMNDLDKEKHLNSRTPDTIQTSNRMVTVSNGSVMEKDSVRSINVKNQNNSNNKAIPINSEDTRNISKNENSRLKTDSDLNRLSTPNNTTTTNMSVNIPSTASSFKKPSSSPNTIANGNNNNNQKQLSKIFKSITCEIL